MSIEDTFIVIEQMVIDDLDDEEADARIQSTRRILAEELS
jgi:hypothetical protein